MLVSKQCWKISISDGVGQDAWIASMSVSPAALVAFQPLSASGRFLPVTMGRKRPKAPLRSGYKTRGWLLTTEILANPNVNSSLRSSERSSTAIPACHSIDSKWLNFCWLTKGSARK